ncbi:hypothetical protein RhiirA5_492520 [Rhizophagus irregularis]|uniref:Ubiquitin-like domain-containing protein n=1 Tax=Rhizophagus irregularis TaxID=588596 RepID=A0A2I1EP86_9GLOM
MSELSLVAAALSSIINHPVKTYRECVANGLDVLPNQFLDLDLVHKYSFVKEGDDKVVQKPSFRQGDEIDEIDEIDEKVVHRRSRQGDEKNEKNVNRRSRQDDEKDEKVVDRCSFFNKKVQGILDINILPPQPIQIFVKASFGKSHSIFVAPNITVLELKQAIQAKLYIHRPIRLGFSGKILNDSRTLESYKIKRSDTIHILFRILGGCEFYVIDDDFLDPKYDYDFTNLRDDGTKYIRGNVEYKRPYGWKRIALNVKKYGNDDEWLGSVGFSSKEWPVSYHGTDKNFANSIANEGYLLSKGVNFYYGKGIYSTPEVGIAEGYSSIFYHEGCNWKVVFQNRVNPEGLKKADPAGDGKYSYWITPDEKNIRPYGLCMKKVQ